MRRVLAGIALAWDVAALAAPSVVGVLTGHRIGAREAVAVEMAGTGARVVELAGGDARRLEAYRRVLGRGDDAYVAFFSLGLMLGVLLLDGRARGAGVAAVCGAASADLVENRALDRALLHLIDAADQRSGADPVGADLAGADPVGADPAAVDPDLVRARRAARIKFGLLMPAAAMSLAGIWQQLRPGVAGRLGS